jgi:hypothetical protein
MYVSSSPSSSSSRKKKFSEKDSLSHSPAALQKSENFDSSQGQQQQHEQMNLFLCGEYLSELLLLLSPQHTLKNLRNSTLSAYIFKTRI